LKKIVLQIHEGIGGNAKAIIGSISFLLVDGTSWYFSTIERVSQGFWGTREHWQNIEGNKGTLANFWEQGK